MHAASGRHTVKQGCRAFYRWCKVCWWWRRCRIFLVWVYPSRILLAVHSWRYSYRQAMRKILRVLHAVIKAP